MYQIRNTKSELIINVAKSNIEYLEFNICDINGNKIISKEFGMTGHEQTLITDISNLQSGTYICNLVSNGLKIGEYKFIIIK